MYIADTGRLVVSFFSLFNFVNVKGAQYDQGELLRWLGESFIANHPPTQQKTPLVIHSYIYGETHLGLQGCFLIFQCHFQRDR
jgi:hypothetical protein